MKEVLAGPEKGGADFAVADLSITSSRTKAVVFSMPWMNLGEIYWGENKSQFHSLLFCDISRLLYISNSQILIIKWFSVFIHRVNLCSISRHLHHVRKTPPRSPQSPLISLSIHVGSLDIHRIQWVMNKERIIISILFMIHYRLRVGVCCSLPVGSILTLRMGQSLSMPRGSRWGNKSLITSMVKAMIWPSIVGWPHLE